jgi:hypothetical protein
MKDYYSDQRSIDDLARRLPALGKDIAPQK